MKLSNRLYAIATFVETGSSAADIGTDHGFIPAWLALNGICENITAADINEGPLESAKLTAYENNVYEKIRFIRTDGLKGIDLNEIDTVIIAGMGGETIINIIKDSILRFEKKHTFILQPMTKQTELCRYLYENEFYIDDERLAEDSGEIYRIIKAKRGRRELPEISYLSAGEALFSRNDPLLKKYLEKLIDKTSKAIKGMESGKHIDEAQLYLLKRALKSFNAMNIKSLGKESCND